MATKTIEAVDRKGVVRSLPAAKHAGADMINRLSPEDQVLLTTLLTEPAEYVADPDFSLPSIETHLFGAEARLASRSATRFTEQHDGITTAVLAGERIPTLNAAQERHLFKRFNYARQEALRILVTYAGRQLTAAATRRLLAWGHRVLTTRGVIVRVNMPLVLAMAKRTRLSGIDFNDLISEGNMALLRSVEKFDASRGFKFSTYSCRAILKSFSRVAMRTSRYRGKFPAVFDPAMERSDYLDRKRADAKQDCVDELKEIMIRNAAGLSDVERTVIKERFALTRALEGYSASPKTLEQVGRIIGVTKERVRQIQNNALKKIRVTLEETYLAA